MRRYDESRLLEDLPKVSRGRVADEITGGLSFPSKMPCPAWGISASRCQVGSVLAQKEGSVCSKCYANKGFFSFPNAKAKYEERFQGLEHELWTPAMAFLIGYYAKRYFRFFESGDLQGAEHLHNIAIIARHLSDVLFWLPTKEYGVVRKYVKEAEAEGKPCPENLRIRLSAPMIDGEPPNRPYVSRVVTGEAPEGSHSCPAKDQGNKCVDCRACWTKPDVSYPLH